MNRSGSLILTADTSGIDDALAQMAARFDQFRQQDQTDNADYWQVIVTQAQTAQARMMQQDAQFNGLIANSASQGLLRMLQGRESFTAAAEALGDRLLQRGLSNIIKASLAWIEGEARQTLASSTGVSSRTALQAEGATTARGINAATSSQGIMAKAADAAAGAYDAMAGIPVVGPALGAAAAAATFAAVAAYGSLFSAAGGWDQVPFDNALTALHKDEMVLSAPYANVIRGLSGGEAAAPSSVTAHFHAGSAMPAMTHAEFKRFVSANMDHILQEAGNAHRNAANKLR